MGGSNSVLCAVMEKSSKYEVSTPEVSEERVPYGRRHTCQSPPCENERFFIVPYLSTQGPDCSAKLSYLTSLKSLNGKLAGEVLIKLFKHEKDCIRLGLDEEDTFMSMGMKLQVYLETGIIDSSPSMALIRPLKSVVMNNKQHVKSIEIINTNTISTSNLVNLVIVLPSLL